MTQRAGRWPAVVATACPTGRPRPYRLARNARHSSRIAGPPLRWIAPSTPPPPSSDELAALTIASTRSAVMSPVTSSIRTIDMMAHEGAHHDDPSEGSGPPVHHD